MFGVLPSNLPEETEVEKAIAFRSLPKCVSNDMRVVWTHMHVAKYTTPGTLFVAT